VTALLDRRGLLCDQPAPPVLTGIDFVQVDDTGSPAKLLVFFVVDPGQTVPGPGPAPMVATGALPLAFAGAVTATAEGGGESAAVRLPQFKQWRQVTLGGVNRTALYLEFAQPTDFAHYRLHIDHPAIDPFFNDVLFSFKQGCDTGFDCATTCACPAMDARDVEIDYLARDFDSFSIALSDFAARYYPEWGERITADQGVMLQEIMAALGDEFSYIQDRYAREMYIDTATQRRSLMRLSGLVDYVPDPGCNASTLLSLDLVDQAIGSVAVTFNFADRLPFWAVPEGRAPIPFELGDGLADAGNLFAHASWNQLALHMADAGSPCLDVGATECLIKPTSGNARLPLASQIPAGNPPGAQAWVGRKMILWSQPTDPAVPVRAWPVTIEQVDQTRTDPLQPFSPGQPLRLTRLRWRAEEALPFALRIDETVLLGNVAPATSGRTVRERFRIGPSEAVKSPAFSAFPPAVERQGPTFGGCCERTITMLHGLAASESEGVNHTGPHGFAVHRLADVTLRELDPAGNPANDVTWLWHSSLMEAAPDELIFTLDPGMVRPVVHFQRGGEIFEHSDYASDAGWTLRFGGGDFARTPDDGSAFEVAYRTLLGRRSNLAPLTIKAIDPPDGAPRMAQLVPVLQVRNPLAASGGVDAETPESLRETAPEAWSALPLNAVRDEHYRQIVERELSWVQRAGAVRRWTGTWLTTFVTADPYDAFAYTSAQRSELESLVDTIRMAGHEATVRDPVYISLDLEISVCLAPGHFAGDVREAVIAALTGRGQGGVPALFDPDNFTFGQPLFRSSVEAAVQAVPGVLGVPGICIRKRGVSAWAPFDEPELRVAANAILRIDNDPLHPERGSVRVHVGESAGHPAGCACCTA
jgi:hypothetical protein